MSEQLREAAERARSERRQRLVREVAPYLEPGEHVFDATSGRSTTRHGGERHEPATLRVVVTDRRLLVLRKKAFRQFSVQAFSYATARVSIGFTAEAGGEVAISDLAGEVRVGGIPELDLEPLFAALLGRIEEERLEIELENGPGVSGGPQEPEEPPVVVSDEEAGSSVGSGVRLVEPLRVGAQTIEEILAAAGFPPEPGAPGSTESEETGAAAQPGGGRPAEPFRITERPPEQSVTVPPTSELAATAGEDVPVEMPTIIPDADVPDDKLAGAAEAGILRWMISESGADAGIYLRRDPAGEEHLQVEPRRLDAQKAIALVRRAEAALSPGAVEPPAAEEPLLVTRWGESGDERVLILSGVRPGSAGELIAFARFVLDRLELAPQQGAGGEPVREVERPKLEDVSLSLDDEGLPLAVARLGWRGREHVGSGHGHSALLGRHLAAARAVADALGEAFSRDILVEHLFLTYPPMDAELVVVTVLIGAQRFVGATAVPPGDESRAAAHAVLDALNRNLPSIAQET